MPKTNFEPDPPLTGDEGCWCCNVLPDDLEGDHPWPCTCVDAKVCGICLRCYAHCQCENPVDLAEFIIPFWRDSDADKFIR